VGDKGQIYKKGWDGEYRPEEGLLGPKEGEVKKGLLSGEPVPARDFLGNQKHAADGTPLYEAAGGDGGLSGEALIGVLILGALIVAAIIAIAIAIAVVVVVGAVLAWWARGLFRSIKRDRAAGVTLSTMTLGWLVPGVIGAILIGVVAVNLQIPHQTAIGAGGGGAGGGAVGTSSTGNSGITSSNAGYLPSTTSAALASSGSGTSLATTEAAGPPTGSTAETLVKSFFAQWDVAFDRADVDWLDQHLNGVVIAAYGEITCRQSIAAYAAPDVSTTVESVGGPSDWTYAAGTKNAQTVSSVYSVVAVQTRNGKTTKKTIHAAYDNGGLTWFTYC
jgi:hypothetical protein